MVAHIKGFRTRAQVGLIKPKSVSYKVNPEGGGLVVHWNGPRAANTSHDQCEATWRNVQKFHMAAPRNWVDIAYSIAFCNHGYVLAGRGYGVRTAANGTNHGNQYFLAAYWIGGEGQTPTGEAYDALDWIIVDFRKKGAGKRVQPHEDFTGSRCPGADLKQRARERDNKNIDASSSDKVEPVNDFERWWASLDKETQTILEEFAKEVKARGGKNPGRSIAHQFFIFHDKERPMLQRLNELVGVSNPGGALNTTLQGATAGGLNAYLYLNDKHNANLDTEKRYGA